MMQRVPLHCGAELASEPGGDHGAHSVSAQRVLGRARRQVGRQGGRGGREEGREKGSQEGVEEREVVYLPVCEDLALCKVVCFVK